MKIKCTTPMPMILRSPIRASMAGAFVFVLMLLYAGPLHAAPLAKTATAPLLAGTTMTETVRFVEIAPGPNTTCARTARNALYCWGADLSGNSGTPYPVPMAGMQAGVTAMDVDHLGICAVVHGGVSCWGWREEGISTVPDLADVQQVSIGNTLRCALLADNTVACWTMDYSDEVRIETPPTPVAGLHGTIEQLSVGQLHACALISGSTVSCWGGNYSYQLGRTTPISSAVALHVDGINHAIQVAVGDEISCAVTAAGEVLCWGNLVPDYSSGNNDLLSPTPTLIEGLPDDIVKISIDQDTYCALSGSGRVFCWGMNWGGRVGNGTTGSERIDIPYELAEIRTATDIYLGGSHACAMLQGGDVACWGDDGLGQLGRGTYSEYIPYPTQLDAAPSSLADLELAHLYSCGLAQTGALSCWGRNWNGELGDGTQIDRYTPAPVIGLEADVRVTHIAAGWETNCLAVDNGTVHCWGARVTEPTQLPRAEPSLQLVAGTEHYCSRTQDNHVQCWGDNTYHQLGVWTPTPSFGPVRVSDITTDVVTLAADRYNTCAVTVDDDVICWGNMFGDRDNLNELDYPPPSQISGFPADVKMVTLGWHFACALTDNGEVYCWGEDIPGDTWVRWDSPERLVPVRMDELGRDVVQISAKAHTLCALHRDGAVQCWDSHYGVTSPYESSSSYRYQSKPKRIEGLPDDVDRLYVGGADVCVQTESDELYCWGKNDHGQLAINPGWTPALVRLPAATGTNTIIYVPLTLTPGETPGEATPTASK